MTEDWLFYLWTGIIIGYFACGVSFGNSSPKKELVGLTNEDIDDLWKTEYFNIHYELPRAIEAKLKEKNRG